MLRRDLDTLAGREHDVLVVGGGIHGAAAAWEAASRGLATALVEADDFAGGASWNSLKTIHGGLRHLQRLDLASLRESARERRTLLAIAPGLVRPLAFLVPTYGHAGKGREVLAAGLAVNHLLTLDRNRGLASDHRLPPPRLLSPEEVRARVPGIAAGGLTGGALYWDAQVRSSERLVIALLHAAAGAGAALANHAPAASLRCDGGRVTGAVVRDELSGREVEVRARVVVNAAGPAAADLWRGAGLSRPPIPHIGAVNLVLRRAVVRDQAVGSRTTGRFLFVVPWEDRSIVGTAYGPAEAPREELAAAFLDEAARAYPWAGLTRADVALVHYGRVPGEGGAQGLWTRSRIVDHAAEGARGLVSMVGVKYTTARALAERAIDRASRHLPRPAAPSRTAVTPLAHARMLDGPLEDRARVAAREEMAATLADAVLRRLDLGTAGAPDPAAVDVVSGVLARELGWDAARLAAERRALADAIPMRLG